MREIATSIENAANPRLSRSVLRAAVCLLPFLLAIHALSQANRDFQVGMDFRMTYAASRAWLSGVDPYDDAALKNLWRHCGMPHATPPGLPQTPNVYPLSVAPLLAPITWMPFPEALAIWLVLNAAAVSVLAWQMLPVYRVPRSKEPNRRDVNGGAWTPAEIIPYALVFILLIGFPFRYGLTFGNLAVLTTFLVAQTLIHPDRPVVAGVCYGFALVKYSLCGPLALLFVLEKRWRLLLVAAVVQAALLGVATVCYADVSPLSWVPRMLDAGLASMAPGAVNDYAALNYSALHLELAALLHRLSPSLAEWRHLINVMLGVVGCAAMLRGSHAEKATKPASDRLARQELRYVVVLALTMLAVYHRVYDLFIVVVPLVGWLIRHGGSASRMGRAGLGCAVILATFAGATVAGGGSAVPWLVLAFVQPVAIWATLLILVIGWWELARSDAATAPVLPAKAPT